MKLLNTEEAIVELRKLMKERAELVGIDFTEKDLSSELNIMVHRLKSQINCFKDKEDIENTFAKWNRAVFNNKMEMKRFLRRIFGFPVELDEFEVECGKPGEDINTELISNLPFMGVDTYRLTIYCEKTKLGHYIVRGVELN